MHQAIETRSAPAPIGPYSQAIRAGDFIFVSGQIPLDPASGQIVGDDAAGQAERVMQNLAAILEAAGSSLAKVVKTTIYLQSLEDFGRCNEVYGRFMGENKPARATVQVARLPKDALVEIEVVALA